MKLPQFGKKLIGMSVEAAGYTGVIIPSQGVKALDMEADLLVYFSDGSKVRHTIDFPINADKVLEMAKALGLIPATTPKATRHHKTVCTHGCKLTPENTIVLKSGLRRCRKHYLEYNAKRNAERRAKRAEAKGGQK